MRGAVVAFYDTMIEFAILTLLRDRADYGYRLRQRFAHEVGSAWCLNIGQVYQALHKLQQRGLVAERDDPAAPRSGGGPGRNRRIFAITEKGERSLDRWLRRVPTRPRPLREEILLRLLTATHHGEVALRQVLSASERVHRERRERAAAEQRRAQESGRRLGSLGLAAEIARLDSHLTWLERCRKELLEEASAETRVQNPDPRQTRASSSASEARPPERVRSAITQPKTLSIPRARR